MSCVVFARYSTTERVIPVTYNFVSKQDLKYNLMLKYFKNRISETKLIPVKTYHEL